MLLGCADRLGHDQNEVAGRGVHRSFDVHSLGFSRNRAGHRASLDLRLCPTADLRHAVDFMIGYITRFLPYGLRTMTSTIVQLHDDLQQASMVCGASFLTTFRRILLPLLRPGFIAGWIILATIFLREFSTSVFLYSPGSEPLGPLALSFLRRRQSGSHVRAWR